MSARNRRTGPPPWLWPLIIILVSILFLVFVVCGPQPQYALTDGMSL